MNVLYNTSRQI